MGRHKKIAERFYWNTLWSDVQQHVQQSGDLYDDRFLSGGLYAPVSFSLTDLYQVGIDLIGEDSQR